MSKIKVKIFETKYRSFYKTLMYILHCLYHSMHNLCLLNMYIFCFLGSILDDHDSVLSTGLQNTVSSINNSTSLLVSTRLDLHSVFMDARDDMSSFQVCPPMYTFMIIFCKFNFVKSWLWVDFFALQIQEDQNEIDRKNTRKIEHKWLPIKIVEMGKSEILWNLLYCVN